MEPRIQNFKTLYPMEMVSYRPSKRILSFHTSLDYMVKRRSALRYKATKCFDKVIYYILFPRYLL